MNNSEKQLELMVHSMLLDAKNQADAIRADADSYRQKELKHAEDEALDELYGAVEAEVSDIKDKTATHVTRSELDCKKELLLKRDEFSKSIFDEVRNKLLNYTSTPAYEKWLEVEAVAAFAELKDCSFDTLLVREADQKKIDSIQKQYPKPLNLILDKSIVIGGFKLVDHAQGIFVDRTLDTKLTDQKDWFYANSGLAVV